MTANSKTITKRVTRKYESLLEGDFFYFLPRRGKIKAVKTEEMKKKVKRIGKSRKRKDKKHRR
jgi:hypothetical protein